MKASERVRKQMEERGLLGTDAKKAKEIAAQQAQKKGTAKATPSFTSHGQRTEIIRDTGLLTQRRARLAAKKELEARAAKIRIDTSKALTAAQQGSQLMRSAGYTQNLKRSTANSEKKRLYETNDSLLSPQEIMRKYQYVARDKDMGYKMLRRAVQKGTQELGKAYKGKTTYDEETKQAAELQARLQSRLKSASFTAGLLEGTSGGTQDVYNLVLGQAAKKSGNEKLTSQAKRMQAQLEETKAQNPGWGTVGQLTGEFGKAGAGYMTIGKVAEKGVQKGAEKLGKKMATATTPDAMQKLAAGVLFDPKKAKTAQFVTRMLGQQAADTAVNTPITIVAGMAEGKNRKEILQDIGKQEAMDAAFNIGLAGLGAGAKALRNRSRKGPIARIDFEKIGYDRAKVDEDLIAFKKGVDEGTIGKWQSYELKNPTERAVKDITEKSGIDISGFGTSIKPDELTHIEKRHGIYGEADNSMADVRDLGKIQYVLDNYDNVNLTGEVSNSYKNSDGLPAKMIIFDKRINGTYYVVEAVPDSKRKKLQIISAYKSKKREGYQVPDANMPPANGRTALELPSNNSIPQNSGNVKATARAEKINAVAQTLAENKNILAKRMDEGEIRTLREELANLQDPAYRKEMAERIAAETGSDQAAYHERMQGLRNRENEIKKMLMQQEAIRSDKTIRRDAAKQLQATFNLQGKRMRGKMEEALSIAIEQAKEGKLDRDALFRAIWKKRGGLQQADRNLLEKIQGKRFLLSVEGAADISDIHHWNKAMQGKMGKIKIGRNSNVEAFYMQLSKEYPGIFPESIDNEAGQMKRIRLVAENIANGHRTTEETAREDFERILNRLLDDMDVHAAYAQKMNKKTARGRSNLIGKTDYGTATTDDVLDWHKERHRLQEKANQTQNTLTKLENALLQEAMETPLTPKTEKELAQKLGDRLTLFMEQYNLRKPLQELDEKINGYKRFQAWQKDKLAAETVGRIELADGKKKGWKDKAIGSLYGSETQERNIYDIAPDKETAERIIETYFTPIHEHERDRILMIKDLKARVKQTGLRTEKNIKITLSDADMADFPLGAKTSESALAQWLGEKRYELLQMKMQGNAAEQAARLERQIAAVEEQLSPEQRARIDTGIKELQEIYKELHPRINEIMIQGGYDPIGYIEGYFPHMNFNEPEGIFRKVASALGFDFSEKELPMDIAGRTENFRPGKRWAGNLLHRTGEQTDYDAIRAFDLYIDNISDVIYHTEDIRKIRSMADYVRYNLSDEGLRKEIQDIRLNAKLSPEEKRTKLQALYRTKMKEHKLQNWVNDLETYADLLAGKKHKIDRPLENSIFGRKIYSVLNKTMGNVAGNMVAGNIGSALTNFIPITQGMSRMSLQSNLRGLEEALLSMGREEMDELTRKSAFLATRQGPEMLYRTAFQKFSDVIGQPMEWADKFSTQAVWRSRYYDNLAKGMTEDAAIKNADAFARGLFAGRSKGAMPTLFSAKMLKPFTMFQLEVNNQLRYLAKDIPREAEGDLQKIFSAYFGIAIGAYLYNDTYEKITGRRSALDPAGTANELIGNIAGKRLRNIYDIAGDYAAGKPAKLTETAPKEKPSEALKELSTDIGGNIPFLGGVLFDGGRIPIKSAIPHPIQGAGAVADALDGEKTWGQTMDKVDETILTPASYLLPVIGTGQLRKSGKGILSMAQGGSYQNTKEGKALQYATDQDNLSGWAQAALFGKWATPEARKYMETGKKGLSVAHTEIYDELVASGMKNTRAYETIQKINRHEKKNAKRTTLSATPLSDEQKGILYYGLLATDKEKEILDHFKKKNTLAAVDCLDRIAREKRVTQQREAVYKASLSEEEKKYIYLNKIVGSDDLEKEKGKIDTLVAYGISMTEYLKIKNKYGQLYGSEGTAEQKAAWMSQWMQEQGYTWQQRTVIGEVFPFWSKRKKVYR